MGTPSAENLPDSSTPELRPAYFTIEAAFLNLLTSPTSATICAPVVVDTPGMVVMLGSILSSSPSTSRSTLAMVRFRNSIWETIVLIWNDAASSPSLMPTDDRAAALIWAALSAPSLPCDPSDSIFAIDEARLRAASEGVGHSY